MRLIFLFGSAADSAAEHVRDVDLAIRAVPPLGLEDRLQLGAELVARTGGEFDLLPLDDASIVLAREVADGVCLFARTPEDEVEFVTRARARFLDFKPYLDVQWRSAAARQEARRHGARG